MTELDGIWEVVRTSGALPPMLGVRKRIRGVRGETLVGPLPGVPFDVVGLELRYRAPFAGLVDELAPDGDGFNGRALFRGREIGRFAMHRTEEARMTGDLEGQLVKHIDEAYAMEQNVLRMLDSMISSTEDPEIKGQLEHHKHETEQHVERLKGRLEAHGATPSMIKEAGGILGAVMKGVLDLARPEKAGRNARDGFATEHMEIASYELLERIARRAGDEETAKVAEQNRLEEQAMAEKIAANWDKFVELSLKEQGITV